MTSKIKVDNINKVSDDSNIIKKCGTTTTIGSGASNPIVVDGSAVTLGRCGGTVALASGATQTGFGRTGTVDWITTPKTTGTFTAVSGEGYFLNTSGGVITANLPAGVAGAIVSFADYAATWQTSNVTVAPNGTDKIGSTNANATLSTEGQSVTFVYVDSTQGWVNTMDSTSNVRGQVPFVCASVSGACNTLVTAPCCANTKIATFTGPGNFTVNTVSGCAANNVVSYLIVAGGGSGGGAGGGAWNAGGGGAGGFRESKSPVTPYTASPLISSTPVTVSAQVYAIAVGAGGAQQCGPVSGGRGNVGSVSSFAGIVSAGGGGGGQGANPTIPGAQGGSGGGGGSSCGGDPGYPSAGGGGNEPPVSPPQGNSGGASAGSTGTCSAGGGGGAGGTGQNGPGGNRSGGVQVNSTITSTSTAYAQGGQSGDHPTSTPGGGGGPNPGGAGDANTGGGGGGSPGANNFIGSAGGSGIVVIRYKFQQVKNYE